MVSCGNHFGDCSKNHPDTLASVLVVQLTKVLSEQPALFELRDDCRPRAERTPAGRFREPTIFALLADADN
jgi:hypothetical protein